MGGSGVVDGIVALQALAAVPRVELEWLAARGTLEMYEAGSVMARTAVRVEKLWIVLAGHVVIRVDRGAGPRLVMEWRTGDILGMLPYSRMKGPPGDLVVEEAGEGLAVPERNFPEMISRCPTFTAHTVHLMLDRARDFNTSDLQDEKMVSLGKLAAGLAHELNLNAVAGSDEIVGTLSVEDGKSRHWAVVALAPAEWPSDRPGTPPAARAGTVLRAADPALPLPRAVTSGAAHALAFAIH